MATIKLTKDMRIHIREMLLTKRFGKEEAALQKDFTALANDCFDVLYSQSLRKQLEALPEGFVPVQTSLSMYIDTTRHCNLSLGKARRVRMVDYNSSSPRIADVLLSKRYSHLKSAEMALHADREVTKREIDGILYAATTAARLCELWPDIKSVVETVCGFPAVNKFPLAVNYEKVNKMLRLPKLLEEYKKAVHAS